MKHVVMPRLPAVSIGWGVVILIGHAALCYPAVTSRGYPSVHPFWESIALYIGFGGFFFCSFFDDRNATRRVVLYVLVPLACVCTGMALLNLSWARPRIGHLVGIVGLIIYLPLGLIYGLFVGVFAIPICWALDQAGVALWQRCRDFARRGEKGRRFRFSLAALLTVVAAFAVCCFAMDPLRRLYDAWPRRQWTEACQRHLRQIALAMTQYHDEHGTFPPAYLADASGAPAHSWRVLLLPYLGHEELYEAYSFDEPWDGPNNSKLINRIPDVYACRWDNGRERGCASYVVITGSGTIFPPGKATRSSGITDGISSTLLVVERCESRIAWTEPRDLPLEALAVRGRDGHRVIRSRHGGRRVTYGNVALADCHTRWLPDEVSAETLRALATASGGESVGDW